MRLRAPDPAQLDLLFARWLRTPDGELLDGRPFDLETYDPEQGSITRRDELVQLSPRQALWIGVEVPTRPDCPGCVLFGTCARHDERD